MKAIILLDVNKCACRFVYDFYHLQYSSSFHIYFKYIICDELYIGMFLMMRSVIFFVMFLEENIFSYYEKV